MKKRVIVLLSGGMDSVTAFYAALQEHEVIGALSFDYGSKHNAREIPFAQWHCEAQGIRHEVIKTDFIGRLFNSSLLLDGGSIPEGEYTEANIKETVVPFRNGIMLSIACGFAESVGAQAVVIGAHAGDHAIYPDCRTDFMQAMNQAMQLGTDEQIELLRPFIHFDKGAIAQLGASLQVDYAKTWSCYNGRDLQCGKCPTCVERREAFETQGLQDPTIYEA